MTSLRQLTWTLALSFLACNQSSTVTETPLTEAEHRLPENALKGLTVGEGLTAQLFASEPLVRNPTNMDIDHLGRVWVVENVNYRPENNPDNVYQDGGDQVAILTDTDGDGKADQRDVFYQDVLVDGAMGICVLGNQVILSSSPHILVLTDENGDDKADKVDTLFTGMGAKQGDHTVHAVSFGPDGRLYFNFGNAAHEMLDKYGNPITDKMGNVVIGDGKPYRQGMVFRCNMDGSDLEVLGHNFRNNYEVSVDSYGTIWQSDNDDDGNKSVRINYVMEYGNFGYKDELTGAAWQVGRTGQHEEIPARHWHQNDPGVIPNFLITGSGSPCGITVYEGDLLPEVYQGQVMHGDAGPGAVRAFPAKKEGAGFGSSIQEMLMRKTDAWYRPTDVCVAPDGSVFAADWYDPGVGGHLAGDAKQGRIYRLSPKGGKYKVPMAGFDSPEKAATALKSPNSATRFMAFKALAEAGEAAKPALEKIWESKHPRHRARALWLLARIDASILDQALADSDPDIRMTAIRVARQVAADKILPVLEKAAEDPAPEVRREVAIALREIDAPQKPAIWAKLAAQHNGKDRWYLEALGIGAMDAWDACLAAWKQELGENWNSPSGRDIIWRSRANETFDFLVDILGDSVRSASEQARFLRATDFVASRDKDQQLTALLSMERKDKAAFQRMALTHISPMFAKKSSEVKAVVQTLLPDLAGTREYLDLVRDLQLTNEAENVYQMVVNNPEHELGVRAANLLGQWQGWEWMDDAVKGADKEAIIQICSHINRGETKAVLKRVILNDKEEMTVRKQAVRALAWDWGWEQNIIRILKEENLPDELLSAVATTLLGARRPVDRQIGIDYLDQLSDSTNTLPPLAELALQEGDITHGQATFKEYCSACHKVNGEGIDFGPELSEIGNKLGKDALFSSIMYPDAGISHGFEGYLVTMKDGATHMGYVLSESSNELSMKTTGGIIQNLNPAEIASREALLQSLMTPGLHLAMGEEKLVDVVSYLASLQNQATMASNPYQGQIGYER